MTFPATFTIALMLIASSAAAEDATRIYVYALRNTPARSWMPVFCDGQVMADVRAGAYFAINIPAGRHILSIDPGVPLPIDIGSNETKFIRVDWHHEIGKQPIPVLNLITAELAESEIRFLSYIEQRRQHSALVAVSDPQPRRPQLRTRTQP